MKGRMQGEGSGGRKEGRQVQRRREERRNKLRVEKWSSESWSRSSTSLGSSRYGIEEVTHTPTSDEGRSLLVLSQDYDDVKPFMDRFKRFLQRYRTYTQDSIDKNLDPRSLNNKERAEYKNAPEQFQRAVDATIDALVELEVTDNTPNKTSKAYVANAYKELETIANIYKSAKSGKVEKTYLKAQVDTYCEEIKDKISAIKEKPKKEKKPPKEDDMFRGDLSDGNDLVVIGERGGGYIDAIVVGRNAREAGSILRSSGFEVEGSTTVGEYELIQCWTTRNQVNMREVLEKGDFNVKSICDSSDIGVFDLSSRALYKPNLIMNYATKFI